MQFTKMHGIGNDYVYIDCFEQAVDDPAAIAPMLADRHYGIGGDGLILVMPSDVADVRMRMFNADGSEAQMCGNGIRCVGKYAFDHGRSKANPMAVETPAGIKKIELHVHDGHVASATVDMGEPILRGCDIPVTVENDTVVDAPLSVGDETFAVTCVSMGNPHATIFVDDISSVDLETLGRAIEHHPMFPQRVNVHFVQVHDSGNVTMRTWERGSGATLACGTGASAVCVAGVLAGRSGRTITAALPGGDLQLQWCDSDNHLYMTGPAEEVFSGTWQR